MEMTIKKGSKENMTMSIEQITKHGYQIPGFTELSNKESKNIDPDFEDFGFDINDFDD